MPTVWTLPAKPTTAWVKPSKPSTTWATNSFILKEDAFYLLLETGFKIILNLGAISGDKPTTAWTNPSKP